MAGVNKAIIVGNVGNDPDINHSQGGTVIASLSVATSESWKDKNTGEKQEKTEWHRVTAFGKLAEIIQKYISKGSKVYIEGRLQTDKYEKDGQTHYATKIIANQMQMLDSKGNNQGQPAQSSQAPDQSQAPAQDDGFEDDIPFN